jgi:hypothetical protein
VLAGLCAKHGIAYPRRHSWSRDEKPETEQLALSV